MGSAPIQGRLWGAAAADWSQLNEPAMTPVYEAVFDAVGVGSGTRLLDAGCGSGLALQLANKRGANVSGLDASAALLVVARERVPEADLREGDLEALPFHDDAFDAVTAFNAVQYAADPVAALGELRRVASPGAPVAVVTWAEAERCETRVVLAAIGRLLPPPPPGAGGPFALSAPGRLEELLGAAGLRPQRAGEAPAPFIHPDLDSAVRAHLAAAPARRAIEHAGRRATADVLREALTESRQPDGSYRQDNAFRYVIATAGVQPSRSWRCSGPASPPYSPRLRPAAHQPEQHHQRDHPLSHWSSIPAAICVERVVLLGRRRGMASLPSRQTASLSSATLGAPRPADRLQGPARSKGRTMRHRQPGPQRR